MADTWATRKSLLLRARDQSDESAWTEFLDHYRKFVFSASGASSKPTTKAKASFAHGSAR